MSYGLYKNKNGTWFAKVPNIRKKDGYLTKGFYNSKWIDAHAAAALWQDKKGREIWGSYRWDLILTYHNSAVRRLRSPIYGVSVFSAVSKHKHHNIEYPVFVVSWRDYQGKKHNETFSPKRSGTLKKAEVEANIFACHKRAELTGGELNLRTLLYSVL